MKKFYIGFTVIFIIYIVLMSAYLFNAEQSLPDSYINSPADPSTFMTEEEITKSTIYSRTKDLLFFVGIPWEWAIYLIILGFGFATSFNFIAIKLSKKSLLFQSAIFVLLMSLMIQLLKFPLEYYSYKVSVEYGVYIQSFDLWLIDKGKSFIINYILTFPVVFILYYLIRRFPNKWWFLFWMITVPLTILLFFVQPVIIDPIFNDFQELQDEQLKEDILNLADKANIPAEKVYQVNMSEKTNAMNAYVTGIGSNARIVLWDTTLQKLNKDEILFIMAHEMGHYVYKHIYWMLFGSLVLSLALFYIGYKLVNWIIYRFGHNWGIRSVGELSSLPLILLILSVLTFATTPVENSISREAEKAADAYGIRMTQNKEAAISAFQKLTIDGLGEPNPPKIVKIFKYSHPTIAERIYTIDNESQ